MVYQILVEKTNWYICILMHAFVQSLYEMCRELGFSRGEPQNYLASCEVK